MRAGFGLKGEYKVIIYNADGSIDQESDWEDNLITDNGLIIFGVDFYSGTWHGTSCVGSGTTPAANTDTQLDTLLGSAGNGSVVSSDSGAVAPDYEVWAVKSYRYEAGVATGTIRELGIGQSSTNLFSRCVIGTPMTKGADQIMDVFYKMTMYPDLTAYTGQVVIKGVTYDWTMQVINLPGASPNPFNEPIIGTFYHPTVYPDTATPGTLTTGITGGGGVNHPSVARSYPNNGSGFRDVYFNIGLDYWLTNNNTIGIIYIACFFGFNVYFEAVDGPNIGGGVPKDNTEKLELTVRTQWWRHTP